MPGASKNSLKQRGRRWGFWVLAGLVVYWFLPTWIWHIRRTADPFTFNDDARILIWPFLREADPTLFPHDPFVDYYQAGLPEGFRLLYRIVGRIGWVKATSEVLQYASVASVMLILVASARRIGGNLAAFVAAVLVLGSEPFFDRAGGGLPRAFAFPLVSAGLYALLAARPWLLAALTVLGAAFYPVVAALLGLCLFLLLVLPEQLRVGAMTQGPLRSWCGARLFASRHSGAQLNKPWRSRARLFASRHSGARLLTSWRSHVVLLAATLGCVVGLLVPMALRLRSYGEAITPSMLPMYPEAGIGGRLGREHRPPYEAFTTLFTRHARATLVGIGPPIGGRFATWLRGNDQRTAHVVDAVVVGAVVSALLRGRRRPELWRIGILLLSAAVGHLLACLLSPRLFLPERYAQFAVPPSIVLLVAAMFGRGKSTDDERRDQGVLPRIAGAALLVGVLGGRGTSWVGIEVHVPAAARPLYAALRQLPSNALIAGWPAGPAENIPYLSERRVLTNFQLEMPFHSQFTLETRRRLNALFEAYFATSQRPIQRLCSEFHVTHLLIEPQHFDRFSADYYAPHRLQIAGLFEAAAGGPFLLQRSLASVATTHFACGATLIDLARVPELAPACSRLEPQ